jgi:hypothetical protein
MKKTLLFGLGFVFSAMAFAQETLAPDQNPNYTVAVAKYAGNSAQLQTTNNTTVQNTYKAFDWYENKQEKKQERLEFRRKLRLLQAENSYYNNRYNDYDYYNNARYRRW